MDSRARFPNFVRGLEEWRRELGLSNGRFARHIEMTPAAWSRIRHGQRGVTQDLAQRLIRRREQLRAYWLADLMAA
jgi:plasmid maintenance system antidote protein VapI